jgi:hypothetical protein
VVVFLDLLGLGYFGYWEFLSLAILAWHKHRVRRRSDVRYILSRSLRTLPHFKRRVVRDVLKSLESWQLLGFECRPTVSWSMGWKMCPRDWYITPKGLIWLGDVLSRLKLSLDDVLMQASMDDVKTLINSRIKATYKEHWESVKRYEESLVNLFSFGNGGYVDVEDNTMA